MSRNVSRQSCVATHYNADAPAFAVCAAFDTVCGVNCFMLDRWVSSRWADVTCRRCQRHKARRERFARAAAARRKGNHV